MSNPGDTIDDVYELLNLPAGTLIRNSDGTLWERRNGNPRWVALRPYEMIPEQHMLPSTVIWMPAPISAE